MAIGYPTTALSAGLLCNQNVCDQLRSLITSDLRSRSVVLRPREVWMLHSLELFVAENCISGTLPDHLLGWMRKLVISKNAFAGSILSATLACESHFQVAVTVNQGLLDRGFSDWGASRFGLVLSLSFLGTFPIFRFFWFFPIRDTIRIFPEKKWDPPPQLGNPLI